MSAIDTFISQHPQGSPVDTDGFPPQQPFQCYDVFIAYIRILASNPSLYFTAELTGLAQDIYNEYDTNPLLQSLFDKLPWNATGQRGDVAVWGRSPQTPDSHVAVLEADNGDMQRILGQNQPYPYITERDLTSVGLLGYLRPKVNQPSQGGDDMIDQDTLTILFRLFLNRDPEPDAVNHYVGKYSTTFVVNDLNSSSERATDVTKMTQEQTDVATRVAQAEADKAAAQQADQIAESARANLQAKLDAANKTVSDLQDKLAAARIIAQPSQPGFIPTPSIDTQPSPLQVFVNNLVIFIKQVIGAK